MSVQGRLAPSNFDSAGVQRQSLAALRGAPSARS
jgi:hypothetical protein